MHIMKFGGTSVGSAKNIAAACRIVKKQLRQKPVVVVSAVTKMTDALIELAREASQESRIGNQGLKLGKIKKVHLDILSALGLPRDLLKEEFGELEQLTLSSRPTPPFANGGGVERSPLGAAKGRPLDRARDDKGSKATKRIVDYFQSFGERMSAKIVAAQLEKIGVASRAFPAWEVGMITDDHFGGAEPLPGAADAIRRKIKANRGVQVITGYIGKTRKGEITTLGRGGSDYSAAIIGAAIGAKSIQIWTDVNGVMTADPRIVKDARIVKELAFEEACELAYFGAKVLHPKTILPAIEKDIPVQVLNTFNPRGQGTTIVRTFAERRGKSSSVEAFACKKGLAVLHVSSLGFFDGNELFAHIFGELMAYRAPVDLVAISVAGFAFAIDNKNPVDKIINALQEIGKVSVARGKAIICAVGGSVNAAGVAGKMFSALGRARIPVEMISQAASGVSMTFVVDEKDAEKAMRVLHKEHIG